LIKLLRNKSISLILGPVFFVIVLLVLPQPTFTFEGKAAIGTIAWMACWWVMLPVGPAVTAFIPIVVNAIFRLTPMDAVLGRYASEMFFLLLGAELIAVSWGETGLGSRLSLKALCLIGQSLKQQIAVWFILSTVLSMLLPNLVVCAILTPIAISMLRYSGEDDLSKSRVGSIIVASIAWGAGIGGMGTPLGGAMNLIALDYIEQITGTEFMYASWVIRMLPMLIVLTVVNILILFILQPKTVLLSGTKEYFVKLYKELPPFNRDQGICLVLFLTVIALSFLRPLYAEIFSALKPAFVFIIFGLITFILPKRDGSKLMTWKIAEKKISWGMIFVFSGGMAAGTLIIETEAAESIARLISTLNLNGGFWTILAFVVVTVLIAEISNNTSAAAISIPIVVSITKAMNLNPLPYIFILIVAFNSAYMLPTTIRAIPVGYGLSPKYLFQRGILLTVVGIIVITLIGWLIIVYLPDFFMANIINY